MVNRAISLIINLNIMQLKVANIAKMTVSTSRSKLVKLREPSNLGSFYKSLSPSQYLTIIVMPYCMHMHDF